MHRKLPARAFVVAAVSLLSVLAPLRAYAQTYRLGTDDTFVVRGLDIDELSEKPFRVDPSGSVTLPLVGRIVAAGLTVGELEAEIDGRLKPFVKRPAVSVSVTEVRSRPVSVFGAVNASAVYQARGTTTLMEVLSMAGGLRADAGTSLTVTRRIDSGSLPLPGAWRDTSQNFWVGTVDLARLMSGAWPEGNIQLQANDVVTVQRADLVYVIGDVNKAGAIPITGRLTLTQALARSEGLQRSASRKNIRILRSVDGEAKPREILVDFQKVLNAKAEDHELLRDDIVVIPNNVTRSAALRTIETALQIGTGLIIWGR